METDSERNLTGIEGEYESPITIQSEDENRRQKQVGVCVICKKNKASKKTL